MANALSQIDALIGELRETSRRAGALFHERTAAELVRRPGKDRWSAAECIEHLNLTNRSYLPRLEEALRRLKEKNLSASGAFRMNWNARLLKYWLEPPSRVRVPTGAEFRPGDVNDTAAVVNLFQTSNKLLQEQLASARGFALDAAKIVSPFADNVKYNVYSAYVLIAAHNRRHLWQAEKALGLG